MSRHTVTVSGSALTRIGFLTAKKTSRKRHPLTVALVFTSDIATRKPVERFWIHADSISDAVEALQDQFKLRITGDI